MSEFPDTLATDLEPLLLELGKAICICQALESSLCLLHAMMTHEETGGEEGAFMASWDFHSAKTLGQTINALRKRIDIPADLNNYLEEGIRHRNHIVHGFLTKNMPRLMVYRGRIEVQKELEALKMKVKARDVVINQLLDALFADYGFSNVALKNQAGEMYRVRNSIGFGNVC